jgi:hypothetical protein
MFGAASGDTSRQNDRNSTLPGPVGRILKYAEPLGPAPKPAWQTNCRPSITHGTAYWSLW